MYPFGIKNIFKLQKTLKQNLGKPIVLFEKSLPPKNGDFFFFFNNRIKRQRNILKSNFEGKNACQLSAYDSIMNFSSYFGLQRHD